MKNLVLTDKELLAIMQVLASSKDYKNNKKGGEKYENLDSAFIKMLAVKNEL